MLNWPNALTLLRLAMIPLVPLLFVKDLPYWALAVYLAASLTDVLDGYLARKLNQITKFGKLMDPLADKLMLLTVLVCLCAAGSIPLWVTLFAMLKEAVMIAGAVMLYRGDVVIQANWFGKVATLLFTPSVALAFFDSLAAPWHMVCMLIALAAAYVAMVRYGLLFLKAMKNKKEKPA